MALFSLIGGLLASPPKVPPIEKLNPMQVALQSTNVNQANLPGLINLARDTTNAQQDILLSSLRKSIPRFDEIFGKTSEDISNWLSGVVPSDVENAVMRKSGAAAFAGGFGQAPARANLEARDLGLTSLNLMKTGVDSAGRWTQQAAALTTPGVFNIASMFLNPTQIYQMENEQNLQQFQRQFAKNQINNPYKWNNVLSKTMIDDENWIKSIVGGAASSALGAYTGGMLGGGGQGGQTQPPPGSAPPPASNTGRFNFDSSW